LPSRFLGSNNPETVPMMTGDYFGLETLISSIKIQCMRTPFSPNENLIEKK